MLQAIQLVLSLLVAVNGPQVPACDSYVGRTVSPLGFAAATRQLHSSPGKGEFETTEAFLARTGHGSAGPLILRTPIIERDTDFTYNADAQLMMVKQFAFAGEMFIHHNAIWGPSGPLWDVKAEAPNDAGASIEAVLGDRKTSLGVYRASNAFGASATVSRNLHAIDLLFDRPLGLVGFYPWFENTKPDYVIGSIPVPLAQARALKASLQTALVVLPKPPYTAHGTDHHSPTLNGPHDTVYDVNVLFADVKCGLVTTSSNQVIAAFAIAP
jgi:hypothetical protein